MHYRMESKSMGLKNSSENDQMESRKPIYYLSPGLKTSMTDPKFIVYSDDLVVIIKDKYPKAQHHYLTLPQKSIQSLVDVDENHLSLLKHMHEKAEEFYTKINCKHKFQLGFHAIPSMSQLHMHVISQDLCGPWMKTQAQWNSFTTKFFMGSKKVIEQLESTGRIKFMDTDKCMDLLYKPLRCHICKKELSSMLKLQEHIKPCLNKSIHKAGR